MTGFAGSNALGLDASTRSLSVLQVATPDLEDLGLSLVILLNLKHDESDDDELSCCRRRWRCRRWRCRRRCRRRRCRRRCRWRAWPRWRWPLSLTPLTKNKMAPTTAKKTSSITMSTTSMTTTAANVNVENDLFRDEYRFLPPLWIPARRSLARARERECWWKKKF